MIINNIKCKSKELDTHTHAHKHWKFKFQQYNVTSFWRYIKKHLHNLTAASSSRNVPTGALLDMSISDNSFSIQSSKEHLRCKILTILRILLSWFNRETSMLDSKENMHTTQRQQKHHVRCHFLHWRICKLLDTYSATQTTTFSLDAWTKIFSFYLKSQFFQNYTYKQLLILKFDNNKLGYFKILNSEYQHNINNQDMKKNKGEETLPLPATSYFSYSKSSLEELEAELSQEMLF